MGDMADVWQQIGLPKRHPQDVFNDIQWPTPNEAMADLVKEAADKKKADMTLHNVVLTDSQLHLLKNISKTNIFGNFLKNAIDGATPVEPKFQYPTGRAYLDQSEFWHSKDKGWMRISEMHPLHARNTVKWLLKNAIEFGRHHLGRSSINNHVMLVQSELFNAILERSWERE